MKKDNRIKLEKHKRDELTRAIKEYFQNERDEEMGDLAASMVLDFIIEELAPEFYNQGVVDAYNYMNERVEDLLGIQK